MDKSSEAARVRGDAEAPTTLRGLAGLAIACGALDFGGPLTTPEVRLAETATVSPRSVAKRVRSAIREGGDPLGDALCLLRSAETRRDRGQFFTGSTILNPMVDWVFAQGPNRIVDPGCGSGRFSVACATRRRALSIVAIDLDPLATLLTRAALSCVGAKNAQVVQADYLTLRLQRVQGRTAFIGNPPYVRHHHLDQRTKTRAKELASKTGHDVSSLAGLHALFYLVTLAEHAQVGDIGSFVTSAEWLDVRYGSVIRNMFTNGLGGRSLLVFAPELVAFEDAMTTAAITTFVVGEDLQFARVARITTNEVPTLEQIGAVVEREALLRASRWSPFLSGHPDQPHGKTLGSLFRVSRGQVTGANNFFLMTNEEARQRGLTEYCVPVITSADEIFAANGVVEDAPERRLGLEIPKNLDLSAHSRLAAYLRHGERMGVDKGYVARHRAPWYSIVFPKPPIVATYMARQAPTFALNPHRLGLVNVLHGLHPKKPLTPTDLAHIVQALNETRQTFVGRGRTYHGGLEKFEPKEMEALPIALDLA